MAIVALGPRERIALYLEAVELYHPPMIWIADEVADIDAALQEHVAAVLDSSTSEARRSDLYYLAYVLICRDTAQAKSGSLSAAVERSAGSVKSAQAKRYLDAARRAKTGDCSG
ncbi:MAG: hypothetical protein HY084_04900 [Gemmatimonadetes bacterium]|nr:hypothetical protein [Gemmatimonadota bacterium]